MGITKYSQVMVPVVYNCLFTIQNGADTSEIINSVLLIQINLNLNHFHHSSKYIVIFFSTNTYDQQLSFTFTFTMR